MPVAATPGSVVRPGGTGMNSAAVSYAQHAGQEAFGEHLRRALLGTGQQAMDRVLRAWAQMREAGLAGATVSVCRRFRRKWLRWRISKPRHPGYEPGALPLSYTAEMRKPARRRAWGILGTPLPSRSGRSRYRPSARLWLRVFGGESGRKSRQRRLRSLGAL